MNLHAKIWSTVIFFSNKWQKKYIYIYNKSLRPQFRKDLFKRMKTVPECFPEFMLKILIIKSASFPLCTTAYLSLLERLEEDNADKLKAAVPCVERNMEENRDTCVRKLISGLTMQISSLVQIPLYSRLVMFKISVC